MPIRSPKYIPALKFHWMTKLYDPLIGLGMQEKKLKGHLLRQAKLFPHQRILDVGCGTGTLTRMLKEAQPEATIIGLDADPEILEVAEEKAHRDRLDIRFQQGWAQDLPFEEAQLDSVFSTLLFHHLPLKEKQQTLSEIYRVLAPGGFISILDFDRPNNGWMRLAFLSVQLLDGFETTGDHAKGILPQLLSEAGFDPVVQTGRFNTVAGTLHAYYVQKPPINE